MRENSGRPSAPFFSLVAAPTQALISGTGNLTRVATLALLAILVDESMIESLTLVRSALLNRVKNHCNLQSFCTVYEFI